MRKPNATSWLFRTRKADGTLHPRWRIRYRGPDGKMAYASGVTDKSESRRMAESLATQADRIRRGDAPAPLLSDSESLRPIEEHKKAYLNWGNSQGGRGGRPWSDTHSSKQESALTWWVETLRLKTLRDLDLSSVEKALQEKAEKDKVTGKTLTHFAMTLRTFVNWCRKRKFLASDPLDGLRKFDTTAKTQRRALNLEEVGKLLATAPPERRRLYHLALVTGFRAGELASLRVGDVDEAKQTVFLRADHAKDRGDALVAIPADLAQEITAANEGREPEAQLFQDFGSHHAAEWFDEDREAAGIKQSNFHGKVVFHSLRMTSIQLGIELGFDVKTTQTLARHKTPDLTMNTYAKANPDRLRSAVETLGKAVRGAETAQNSRKEVKQEALPIAVGAENLSQAPIPLGDTTSIKLVPGGGFEPPSPCGHMPLKHACLPIPPPRRRSRGLG